MRTDCPVCGARISVIISSTNGAGPAADSRANAEPLSGADNPYFQAFWVEYPRRIARKPASKAFEKAVKNGASPQAIIDATKVFVAVLRRNGTERQFIPLPATWLNQERFNDEPEEMMLVRPSGVTDPAFTKGTPEWDARIRAEEDEAIERAIRDGD